MIKLVFGLALLLFIGWKVFASMQKGELDQMALSDNGFFYLILVALLMPLNWIMESIKWHLLISRIKPQPFYSSIKDVLAGVSTSILTPNRIGNFIGRTTSLEKENRTSAIIATIHSNLAQFIASVIFGLVGLLILGLENKLVEQGTIQFSAIIVIVLAALLFFFPKALDFNPLSRLYSDQMRNGLDFIQKESLGLKSSILILSLFRYLIFLFQFYLLLKAFNATGQLDVLLPAIAIVYLITTIVPSFLFGKLFVREASALFVLEAYAVQTPVILSTVFLLWFINLALPSLIGGLILFRR